MERDTFGGPYKPAKFCAGNNGSRACPHLALPGIEFCEKCKPLVEKALEPLEPSPEAKAAAKRLMEIPILIVEVSKEMEGITKSLNKVADQFVIISAKLGIDVPRHLKESALPLLIVPEEPPIEIVQPLITSKIHELKRTSKSEARRDTKKARKTQDAPKPRNPYPGRKPSGRRRSP